MEWDGIELDNLDKNHEREKEREEGELDETDLDNEDGHVNIIFPERSKEVVDVNHMDPYKNKFGDRYFEARNIGYFIEYKLLMEKESTNPDFIQYLMDTQDMTIRKTTSAAGFTTDYEVKYYGEPFRNDTDVSVRPFRNFKTTDGEVADPNEKNQLVDDIRYHYDTWKRLELNKIMKKAGIATAIGLSLTALITGLALGLKRSGSDIVRAAKRKTERAEKLTPAEKIIPWTKIEEASGKGLIFIGDHIYLVIGGTLLYLYTRKKET